MERVNAHWTRCGPALIMVLRAITRALDRRNGEFNVNDEDVDPAMIDALSAEIARIVGEDQGEKGGANINYALPTSTLEQLLTLLRGAPSEVGEEGFWSFLEDQFPFVEELRAEQKK